MKKFNEFVSLSERPLTKGEEDKKEDIVKGMKKDKKGFEDRYGDDAKSVMYATATKLAKEETETIGGVTVLQDYDSTIEFREYEVIDIVKPEPMKGMASEQKELEPTVDQEPSKDNEQIKKKEKKVNMMKRQILMKKMQAVRSGAGGDIVAHNELEGEMVEGMISMIKKGAKRHSKAIEKKKIKNRKAVPYAALGASYEPEGEVIEAAGCETKKIENKGKKKIDPNKNPVVEAKVDKGRSDYGKASIRNYRRKGPGHGEPAMFDPENKRGKLIDKRREEHKARRGVKGAKVPAYKVDEGAAWTKKAGKNKEGGLNEKGRKSYERDNPGSDLKAPTKKVGNPRRASFCARMKGMKSKLTSAKTARDPDSRINKSLRKWNCGYEPQGNLIDEEGYDRKREDRLVKYGTGHDGSDRKGSTRYHSRPDTPEQKKRKQAASDQAYKSVVASLKKKYGDGVMTSSRKIRKGKEVK